MSKKYSMELVVERKYKKQGYTIGNLLVDGKWYCNTLEPPLGTEVEMRTAGSKKCIPPGTYNIRMAWSQKFQEILPRIENVSGRFGILIHAGNTVKDTSGCILVGRNLQVGRVLDSRKTLNMILALIKTAIKKEQIKITIK